MKVVSDKVSLRKARASFKGTVGFVPTMGALHAGHASLVERSARDNDRTVVSIFVNPTQFGPKEDFSKYPRTLEADLALCRKAGADLVYTPATLYDKDHQTWIDVENVAAPLCGERRPGHFRGVATVVAKFFNLVQPTRVYFGQKDAQQAMLLTTMARELDFPLEVITCPTVREADGLAMSSRNRYLSPDERKRALVISRTLHAVQTLFDKGERDVDKLESVMESALGAEVDRVDYAEIRRWRDLGEIKMIEEPVLATIAVFVGNTRLIDNIVLTPKRGKLASRQGAKRPA
ncbi:MAG: pantoate--beta-alanine ligase [Planctomycetes bacterium]|nr:pantoate--beta-alanine ligase [Planctomycetota bacterium]